MQIVVVAALFVGALVALVAALAVVALGYVDYKFAVKTLDVILH